MCDRSGVAMWAMRREYCSREERERGWEVGQGGVVAGGQRENGRVVEVVVEVVIEVGNSAFKIGRAHV